MVFPCCGRIAGSLACVDLTDVDIARCVEQSLNTRFELKGFSSLLSIFHSMESIESEEFLFEQQAASVCDQCSDDDLDMSGPH